jgi:tRNA threonylcarbamoyladenosine biosynthesis protein TsaE
LAISMRSHSTAETEALGARIAANLFPGAFIALYGELGAGKTALARGIGEGLGIADVVSPTFTIVQEHEGRLPLFHFDAYRLKDERELFDIGFEEYLLSGGVVLMEWPERVPDVLPEERLDIVLKGSADESRDILLLPYGKRYEALAQSVCRETEDGTLC